MDDSAIAMILRDLADTPAPPSNVDVSRAARDGRQRQRQRQRRLAAAAAAGVTAVVILVTGLPAHGPSPEPAVPTPLEAPELFDPIVQYAEFGWLPDGVTVQVVQLSQTALQVLAAGDHGVPSVKLWLASAGRSVDALIGLPDFPGPSYEQTQFNGRDAWWFEDGAQTILRWQYAPATWAGVEVLMDGSGEGREVVSRVAENVRYGVDRRVRLPFVTQSLPEQLSVCQVDLYQQEPMWGADVSYDADGQDIDGCELKIRAVWPAEEVTTSGVPTTTVDGYPAGTRAWVDGGAGLQVFNVDGLFVEIQSFTADTTALFPDGLVGLFRAIDFYPNPADWR